MKRSTATGKIRKFVIIIFTCTYYIQYYIHCRASPVAVLHRLKNSKAVYPACRKRRLLDTYQLQSDC